MSISSIFPNGTTGSVNQTYAPPPPPPVDGITPALNATDPVFSGTLGISASASVSDGAKLLKQLQGLRKSDHAEFKKVTADIAAQLTAAAKKAGGSEGTALTSLAGKFTQAAQTGTLTPLQSVRHHGGHRPAAAADSSTPVSASSPSSSPSSSSSAVSSAITAYQQATGAANPLTDIGASLRSQVGGIISQVLTTDLGSAAISTSAHV